METYVNTTFRRNASDFLTDGTLSDNVIMTDRIATGNYKLVNYSTLDNGYTCHNEILTTRTHDTGKKADIDIQLEIHGYTEDIETLSNIAVYCKIKKWYFINDGCEFTIISGIANKFHGITSLLKIVNKYSTIESITADVYDADNNTYLFTSNLKHVDVVKTLQKLDRGYLQKLVTDRPDFIALKK